jgi:hypothetical protein
VPKAYIHHYQWGFFFSPTRNRKQKKERRMGKKMQTHQHFFRIADPPGQLSDIAICEDDFGCEFNAKPACVYWVCQFSKRKNASPEKGKGRKERKKLTSDE